MSVKTGILTIFIYIWSICVFAQTSATGAENIFPDNPALITKVKDIIEDPALYQQSEPYFLSNYAHSAADSALIKLTFAKRRSASLLMVLAAVVGGTGVGTLLTIPACALWARYSRHDLYVYLKREANLHPKVRQALLESMGQTRI